jgi:hypothetical protein
MASYRRAYNFTGEPGANENAVDWLAALETNIYSSMTNREKVDLFYSKLFKGSPAKKWFNKLPDEGHRRWHIVKQEFESRWCSTASPVLIAHISTDIPVSTILPIPNILTSPATSTCQLEAFRTFVELADLRTINSFLTTATSSSESENLIALWDRAFKEGYKRCVEKLEAHYEDRFSEALSDFSDRVQESSDNAFEEGFLAGTQEERERWERVQVSKINVTTQTVPTTTTSVSVQSNPPSTPKPTSVTISTQTEPPIPTISESFELPVPVPIPIPISEPPIPATISPTPFNWADNAASLSTIPIIPPKIPRDLSSLRSSSKNPFSSLRRRHSKHQKHLPSYHYTGTQFHPTRSPPHHIPPLLNNLLDWHRDPRLFELSRVLRTLGWSHP